MLLMLSYAKTLLSYMEPINPFLLKKGVNKKITFLSYCATFLVFRILFCLMKSENLCQFLHTNTLSFTNEWAKLH